MITDQQARYRRLFGEPKETTKPEERGTFYSREHAFKLKDALKEFSAPVTVFQSCYITALRKIGETGKSAKKPTAGHILPLSVALSETYDCDAHMVPCQHRHTMYDGKMGFRVCAETTGPDCSIHYLVFDFDLHDHAKTRMNPEIFRDIVAEAQANDFLKNCVWYSTRGGVRIIRRLSEAYKVKLQSGKDWTALYESIVSKIQGFSARGKVDPTSDVPRLFRLNWVTRDNVEQMGEYYVPESATPYDLSAQDRAAILNACAPRPERKRAAIDDKLVTFFEDVGLLREQHTDINGEAAYIVECPLAHHHSSDNPTSTVIHATAEGDYVFNCLHSSCRSIFEAGGGWERYLHTQYPDEWGDTVGREALNNVFEPNNHIQFIEEAVQILETAYPERIFRRQDSIATVERGIYGGARWRAWSVADLTGLLNRRGSWVKRTTSKDGEVRMTPTSVPERMVRLHYVAMLEELPLCETSTTLPPLHPETLEPTRFEEGYCPLTQTYFLPSPNLDLKRLRASCASPVTRDRAILAYSNLTELYHDFPWRDRAHRVLGVAVAMSAAFRRSMDVAPMVFVSANSKGVGKTKLLSTAIASVYGTTPPLASLPLREEELKKALDALVHTDADMYLIDNVKNRIGGAALDAFLTSPLHNYRPLGVTDNRVARNQVFVAATGNNATLAGDTDRRALMIRLVTQLENPETRRGFRFPDLIGEARKRITETWCDLLLILRAFREVSTPKEREHITQTARPLGSFEKWCEIVRDPLMWIANIVEARSDLDIVTISRDEVDVSTEDDRNELFDVLIEYQQHRDTRNKSRSAWPAKEFYAALKQAAEHDDGGSLGAYADTFARLNFRNVSRELGKRRDQVRGNYVLKSRKVGGVLVYRLQGDDQPTQPPTQPLTQPQPREDWRTACDIGEPHDVEPQLIEARPAYRELTKRCIYLKGGTCAKERVPCEYIGADAGLSQSHVDALVAQKKEMLVMIESPPLSPEILPQIRISPAVLEIIAAEVELGKKQKQIADRLNAENHKPPRGRVWTGAKVGEVKRQHQIKKTPKVKETSTQKALRIAGHWRDYWPVDHPLETPNFDAVVRQPGQSGTREASAKSLLTRLFGYAVNCRQAFEKRVKQDAE